MGKKGQLGLGRATIFVVGILVLVLLSVLSLIVMNALRESQDISKTTSESILSDNATANTFIIFIISSCNHNLNHINSYNCSK